MKLLIGIATYKRIEKLERCLHSIHDSSFQDLEVQIVADNDDIETLTYLYKRLWLHHKHFRAVLQPKGYHYVISAWNRVIQENIHREWDGFIGLCDDVVLHPDALHEIVKYHQEAFPDTDGVCGFAQRCPGHLEYTFKWYGQTLMGRKFIERYKDVSYQVCCPFYKHFYQDEEMHQYTTSLQRFVNCPSAILDHDHPSFTGNIDETHNIIRTGEFSPKEHDIALFKQRQKEGKVWGKTWAK